MSSREDERALAAKFLLPPPDFMERWELHQGPYPHHEVARRPPPDPTRQRSIRRALACIEASDPLGAIRELEQTATMGEPLLLGIESVAQGMIADAEGADDVARAHFMEAFGLGVPAPALLGHCGRYFQRRGQFITAYHCFSLLDQVVPGSLDEFLNALPLDQIARFSPAIVPRWFMVPGRYFFAIHRIKRTLIDSLGETATAVLLGQFLGQRSPWHAARRALTSLQDYVLTNDLPYEEIIAPRPVEMSEPEFFGDDAGPAIHGTTRSIFFAVLPDVIVSSKSNFVIAGDSVLMDYQTDELERYPVWFDLDPAVLAANGTSLTVLEHDDDGRQPPLEEGLSLVGMYTYNYAHWIVEKLFKVLVCLDRPGFRNVPVIVDEQMQPAHLEMLRHFCGAEHPVVVLPPGASVKVQRLWTVSSVIYWPGCELPGTPIEQLADAPALARLLQRVEPALRAFDADQHDLRVLLTRKDDRLANRHEVEQWFEESGWAVVDAADLPFDGQMRVIRNAATVVAIGGAAIYGLVFARPGLRFGLLYPSPGGGPPHEEVHWHHEMFRALGHRLLVLPGEHLDSHPVWPLYMPFRVEREQLTPFLKRLESDG